MNWFRRSIEMIFGRQPSTTAPDQRHDTIALNATLGYASRLTLDQQRARLTTFGPYIWLVRDDVAAHPHIWTRCYPDVGHFRIFDAEDGRFKLIIELDTDRRMAEQVLARLVERARELVLEIVDAEDIQDVEPNK